MRPSHGYGLALALVAACSRSDAAQHRPAPAEPGATSSGAAMWGKDYFPNVWLTTQDGKQVRFFDDHRGDRPRGGAHRVRRAVAHADPAARR